MMWKKERTACWVSLDAIKNGSEYSFLPDTIVNQCAYSIGAQERTLGALLSHFISRDYFHFEVCKFYKRVCYKTLNPQSEDCISCNSLSFPSIQICLPQTKWDPSTIPKKKSMPLRKLNQLLRSGWQETSMMEALELKGR